MKPCPGLVGPVAVRIPGLGFCVDSTEVTNAQYSQFLSASPSLAALPATCVGKPTFVPAVFGDAEADFPVVGVDWCDAYGFCAWNGKRLCGKIGGGALTENETKDFAASEWMAACSAQGTRAYPYAPVSYVPMACSGSDLGNAIVKAGSLPSCEGGYPGIFDLSGNLGEWENQCDETSGEPWDHPCSTRGGDFGESPEHLACAYREPHNRSFRDDYIGFRCCSD